MMQEYKQFKRAKDGHLLLMSKDDRELLITDLTSRIKYGVICKIEHIDDFGNRWRNEKLTGFSYLEDGGFYFEFSYYLEVDFAEKVLPYLRPMESMTETERLELSRLTDDKFKFYLYTSKPEIICYEKYNYLEGLKVLDWLNAHHFDYRGLIEKGLALPAPEGMYNIK